MQYFIVRPILLVITITALWACKKDEPEINLASVITIDVEVIGDQKAVATGEVVDNGNGNVSVRGVCWNTTGQPTIDHLYLNSGSGTGAFSLNLEGLSGGTTYYLRTFATNEAGTAYGYEMEFTTESLQANDHFGATIYVHPHDNAPYYVWGTLNIFLNASSMGYGYGNTTTIASQNGVFAAKVCHQLEAFGHDDWYLPAINELMVVYENIDDPDTFPNALYWSSTEVSASEAVAFNFESGEIQNESKNAQLGCRCVRKQY